MPGKVLVVDDVSTNRIVLKVKLSAACYSVLQAENGAEALAMARKERPALILLDLDLPDMNGTEICRRLKANPRTADIPVIVITASRDVTARFAALKAGAEDFLSRPYSDALLLARLRSLLRARSTEVELAMRESTTQALGFAEAAPDGLDLADPVRVAMISAQPDTVSKVHDALAERLPFQVTTISASQALRRIAKGPAPDALVLDISPTRPGDGLSLLSELRAHEETRHAAIIAAIPQGADDQAAIALDLGASDLLTMPVDPEEAVLRISTQVTRKRQADRLRRQLKDGLQLALTDPLTGLYNRRYGLSHLERVEKRSRKLGLPYTTMVVDLDHFKSVNDRHGHAAGDQVLCEVAKRLQSGLRSVDLIARIGGEEFMVLMPDTLREDAEAAAERLCDAVRQRPITLADGTQIRQTISIGLAIGGGVPGPGSTTVSAQKTMERADRALYGAKAAGRNRATLAAA